MSVKSPMSQYVAGMSFAEFCSAARVVACPRHCHNGHHGMDNCNTCGCTGSGIRYGDKFYPNTEEGFREAFKVYEG
jgi:hypothetical protein